MTIDFSFKPQRHGNRRKSSAQVKNNPLRTVAKRERASFLAKQKFHMCQRCEQHMVIKGHVLCKFCDEVLDAPTPR